METLYEEPTKVLESMNDPLSMSTAAGDVIYQHQVM